MMKIEKSKYRTWLIVVAGVLCIGAGATLAYFAFKNNSPNTVPTPQPEAPNSTAAEDNDKVNSTRSSDTTAPNQPRLNKSSGNIGSVPKGSIISFTCEGDGGLSCEILLENTQNPNLNVVLPAEKIIEDGRGLSFASFEWIAITGTWIVTARSFNDPGISTKSESQTLIVNA